MNQLLNISEQKARLTMSSREIASLINKNHSDLCRSIERLMVKGVIRGYQPIAYTHPQNGQIYYDLMTNKRYGLGWRLGEFNVDKWALYQAAQYCDQMVPDG
ncbi:hypothetical protein NMW18_02860, partial [Pasteurella multocida]|nr:hypothetical protein [Pasteurella multocida]